MTGRRCEPRGARISAAAAMVLLGCMATGCTSSPEQPEVDPGASSGADTSMATTDGPTDTEPPSPIDALQVPDDVNVLVAPTSGDGFEEFTFSTSDQGVTRGLYIVDVHCEGEGAVTLLHDGERAEPYPCGTPLTAAVLDDTTDHTVGVDVDGVARWALAIYECTPSTVNCPSTVER